MNTMENDMHFMPPMEPLGLFINDFDSELVARDVNEFHELPAPPATTFSGGGMMGFLTTAALFASEGDSDDSSLSAEAPRLGYYPDQQQHQQTPHQVYPHQPHQMPQGRAPPAKTSRKHRPDNRDDLDSRKGSHDDMSDSPNTSDSEKAPAEPDADASLKRKRLARKAELARDSRLKKKMRLSQLENEVANLKKALAEAQQVQAGPVAVTSVKVAQPAEVGPVLRASQLRQHEALQASVQATVQAHAHLQAAKASALRAHMGHAPADPASAQRRLDACTQSFHKVSAASANAPLQHLHGLVGAHNANVPLHFMQWVLSRDQAFYADGPNSLWTSLFQKKVGASAAAMAGLLQSTGAAAQASNAIDLQVQATFAHLDTLLRKKGQHEVLTLAKMNEALPSEQQATLLQWINQYGAVCLKSN